MADDGLTCDALTGDFRILQRRRGHRFSLDDLATAWVAVGARPGARTVLDLGCGVGSVLLMVAWRLRGARMFGVEAQEGSAGLARRSAALNGLEGRVEIACGDLREIVREGAYPACDLVTGTPPYLPQGTAIASPDPQRAAARIELRGGVEDYLLAAARAVGPGGRVVVCADGRRPDRALEGGRAAGLAALRRVDVIARAGAAGPLLSVWTFARAGEGGGGLEHEAVAMRDERGARTEASRAMRREFGLDAG
ncbi:MAG: methyltransferase domain-containing protein [Polyangiaceae bacterium]|nr:methyltransferase domain-containing protein [Polyangiaceae bacterium]